MSYVPPVKSVASINASISSIESALPVSVRAVTCDEMRFDVVSTIEAQELAKSIQPSSCEVITL